jgi:hypothetical protein
MNDFIGNGSIGAEDGNPKDIYGCVATTVEKGVFLTLN